MEIHPLGIGAREDPARMVFDAAPVPAIVVGMSDMGSRFRLVLNEIDVVEPDEPLPNLPVARAVWEPRPDLRTSTEAWILGGAPHHTVLSTALSTDEVHDLAELARTKLVVIDDDTTIRRSAQELRRNQVYHHLAGSF